MHREKRIRGLPVHDVDHRPHPGAIGINYVGKLIAAALKLPLWLDSIGTVLAAMLAGPWIGAISGAANNVIFGLTADPISFWYLITSIVIGLVVGYMAFTGWLSTFGRAVVLGLVVGVVAAVVSTPINVILWEGQTGNVWGEHLYTRCSSATAGRSGWHRSLTPSSSTSRTSWRRSSFRF